MTPITQVPPYKPGVFKRLYETQLGEQLWSCLNAETTRIRMQTASDLVRPALEGVVELLLERFGPQLLDDRVKQMVGNMTRQVMDHDGYVIDVKNVKLTSGAPFSRATRYKRRGTMTFYVWRLTSDLKSLVLTADKGGHRRPQPTDGTWQYWKSFYGDLRARVSLGLEDMQHVRAEIASTGYYHHRLSLL